MASLKDLRNRIASTKATQKITKAMQMVAASKLRRAQAAAEAARPYAERMESGAGQSSPASIAGDGPRRGCSAAPAATSVHLWSSAPPNAACAARSIPRSCGSRASASTVAHGGKARRSRSSASAGRATTSLRRQFGRQIIEVIDLRSVRTLGFGDADAIGRQDHRAVSRQASSTSARCFSRGSSR